MRYLCGPAGAAGGSSSRLWPAASFGARVLPNQAGVKACENAQLRSGAWNPLPPEGPCRPSPAPEHVGPFRRSRTPHLSSRRLDTLREYAIKVIRQRKGCTDIVAYGRSSELDFGSMSGFIP